MVRVRRRLGDQSLSCLIRWDLYRARAWPLHGCCSLPRSFLRFWRIWRF